MNTNGGKQPRISKYTTESKETRANTQKQSGNQPIHMPRERGNVRVYIGVEVGAWADSYVSE